MTFNLSCVYHVVKPVMRRERFLRGFKRTAERTLSVIFVLTLRTTVAIFVKQFKTEHTRLYKYQFTTQGWTTTCSPTVVHRVIEKIQNVITCEC